MKIVDVDAYQILDSRGTPTVEAVVRLDDGSTGSGLVPSGASTGRFEALELRDGKQQCFYGKSVLRAVQHVREIIGPAVIGRRADDQLEIDRAMIELDGTPDKSRLGANAILGVSMAVANAAAAARRIPLYQHLGEGCVLPLPEIQIIGGAAHAAWRLDVQDFMVVAMGAEGFFQALEMTFGVYQSVGQLLSAAGQLFGVADEGGFWPTFDTNEQALQLLTEGIVKAGYEPGVDVAISIDVAASDLYDAAAKRYRFALEDRSFSPAEFAALMETWHKCYPIVSIEDPMAEDDFDGWRCISQALGDKCQLVGDDLFTTNLARIQLGVEAGFANAVLIKLNQIGTVSETLEAIRATQAAGWAPIVSARSGETEDAFISHLSVATDAGQLKVGSITRGERTAKWNEILRIERRLEGRARFAGRGRLERPRPC